MSSEAFADELTGGTVPFAALTATNGDVYGWATDAPAARSRAAGALPAKFDLRSNDKYGNVVTPVKFQNPWGSCWAFGVVAASEVSILSEAVANGIDLPHDLRDLSERHLAWFAYAPLPNDDDSGQGGEGMISAKGNPNERLNSGGQMVHGTSLFSTGIGPTTEVEVPYKGKEETIVTKTDPETHETYNYCYSPKDDWSVDEDNRFGQLVEFEQSVQLPSPGEYNDAGDYARAERANHAIKQQLHEGRGVAVAFLADQSEPNKITDTGYMNPGINDTKTWAHYTYDSTSISHAVTIVGWDDGYSKENFGNLDPVTGKVDPDKQPPYDGAWIVKNSWGDDGEFPNGYPGGWGTDEDGDGGGDGYFYLSYWDKSIMRPESFDFAVEEMQAENDHYYVHQYDYMPSTNTVSSSSPLPMSMANVFTSGGNEEIRKVTCETTRPNTKVTFDVYLLDDGATSDPTDGAKLATVEQTFDYGGFHSVELGDQAFTLEAGERFSVVVTQLCLDDDCYYISYDNGWNKDGYVKMQQQIREQNYDTLYKKYLDSALDEKWLAKNEEEIAAGKTKDEAKAAADNYIKTEEVLKEAKNTAAEKADKDLEAMTPSYYFNGVVNEGESFVYGSDENGENASWGDFVSVAAAVEAQGVNVDNLPIKAYGYPVGGIASAEAVAQFESDIKSARNDLINTAVSADGTDIASGTSWVTQDVHDTFAAAIAAAEAVLAVDEPLTADAGRASARAALGADGPLAADIERASADLAAARAAFDGAKADGLLASNPEKKPADASALAKTGDPTFAAVAGAASLAALAAGAAAVARRRSGKER